jgi:tetratricopeptide (TPR) repeat protein
MRSSTASELRVGSCFFSLLALAIFSTAACGQELGGSGLTPEQELELDYADKLLASGLADYSRKVIEGLTLPPEIMDIRKIKNFGALGEFDKAQAIIDKRGDDGSQEAWTLKLTLADSYYMWGKYTEAQKIYDGFFMESAYKYSQMLLMMDDQEGAARAYRAALLAKPERHIDRQLKSELAEIVIKLAQKAQGDERKKLFAEVQTIVDEILWIQDLWFGRVIVMLAHMKMMQNDVDGAMSLIDDYKSNLKEIDEALKASEAETGEDMTKLSPMAQCRYMIGVIMHDEAKKLLNTEGGDRQRAYELLVGKGKGTSGALQHFLNVFVRYPNTSWAPDAGDRFRQIEETLKQVWDKEIKAKITPDQWLAVERAQFREARALFNQQRFKEAVGNYEQVLSLFPERETSVAALGELAACYIELEDYLLCDVVIRHLSERFCCNKALMTQAGDQVVRIAFKFSERGDQARMREAYDVFFTYFKNHPRTATELFRFAEEEYRANNLDKALDYYQQIVADHESNPLYFDALSKIAYVYSKQEKPADEIKTLQVLITKLKAKENPGHALANATFRFANGLKAMGPKYLPLAIAKYAEIEKMLLDETQRATYQNSADEADANIQIVQASMFYRAMADCMRKTVDKNVQAYYDKKYERKVPPDLILTTYYKAGAVKTLLQLVETFPKSPFAPAALSQAGTLYTVLKKPDDARKTLQRLKKEYPDSSQAQMADFTIGMSLLELDMQREALAYFKKMFDGSGTYKAPQILTAGIELAKAKQYDIAVEAFDRIIKTETERGYLEPARVGKGQALCALKKYKEAADVLRSALADYPSSGHTIELCRSASEAYAAIASETEDANARFDLFNEAIAAMKRARRFATEPGIQAELDVGVARIFERKSAAEVQFGDAAKAEQYRNDAVAAYQTVIMFRNPNDEGVGTHVQDAYVYCLPLLLEMERWNDALQDADRYIKDFPNGRHMLKIRQFQSKARISGGSREADPTATTDAEAPEATIATKEE